MRDDAAVQVHWNETSLSELRANHPDLPFVAEVVKKLFSERTLAPGGIESLDDLGESPTVDALLDSYLGDETRHEFLAFYIEELRSGHRCSRQEPNPCNDIAADPANGLHMCAECGDAYMHGF